MLFFYHSILKYSLRAHATDPHDGYVQFNDTGANNEGGDSHNEDEAIIEDERTPGETGNGGRRDEDFDDAETNGRALNLAVELQSNRYGGAQGPGDGDGGGGGEPVREDGKWDSPLHRTSVTLRLKLNASQTYEVNIDYTFKVRCMRNLIIIS
jgi:hypothetical protein